jgi:tight adherence protein C
MQILLLCIIFFSVAGVSFGFIQWLMRDRLLIKRLVQLQGGESSVIPGGGSPQVWQARMLKLADPIARLSSPKEGWDQSRLRVRFMNAGLRGTAWPVVFFSSKTVLAIAFPGLLSVFGVLGAQFLSGVQGKFGLLLLAAIGYYLPNLVLGMVMSARQRELREALPDAVDLMTICVEAGLALDAALIRAGDEMSLRSPALADELNLVALELRVGSTRENALRNLALRTGVEDIATFVTMLLQSERFGTSVTESMRILADTMREHRRQRAEEAAAKIPVKLLFPLVFFIFPALFLVIIGPALIGIARSLLPSLSGGH